MTSFPLLIRGGYARCLSVLLCRPPFLANSAQDQQGAVELPSDMDDSAETVETPPEIRKTVVPLQRALIGLCKITENILLSM